ncbi:hypothetical protein Pcinc_021511 [Petrolisthes cinctipes]|uniref:Glycosyltransferase family 92 protein n=1 Tax=Petrolisthes cinctipes TaxID=88211 RepID=A0AAE1FGV1_PETCI|nr:hypothetical protein Pcinc_021511 [Petrolisthes cinctipes]
MQELGEKGSPHPLPLYDSKKPSPSAGRMRKYQQLALTVIAAVSLVAFLFYKHEYERLRYTLEYLDTFGEPPEPSDVENINCGSNIHNLLTTPPADWVQVTSDLQVYSAFWDDQIGIGEPRIRVLAAARVSSEAPQDLGCLVWFESENEAVVGSCKVEAAPDRSHGHSTKEANVKVMFLLCAADDPRLMLSQTPHQVQLKVGTEEPSQPVFIHQSEGLKTVADRSTVCVLPPTIPFASIRVVEFIAYHHILGVHRFVLYGTVLTPLARALLDQYGDQIAIQYEEKLFSSGRHFHLSESVVHRVVELDCVYRHRDVQENVLVLGVDQYLILPDRPTLQATLITLGAARRPYKDVAQFHLTSQQVCIDQQHKHSHSQEAALLLAHPVHTTGPSVEAGVAILRPHLMNSVFTGPSNNQHVSVSTASVRQFVSCPTEPHQDTQHLPSNKKFVEKVHKSLLYRKWIINN